MSFQTKYSILLRIADEYNSSENPEELQELPELPELSELSELSIFPELQSTTIEQEIKLQETTTDVLPYFLETSSEIFNYVKIEFDNFRNSIEQLKEPSETNESHSSNLSLLIKFFKLKYSYAQNSPEDALEFFSVIFVLYYAVEYYLGFTLHEIRNDLSILNQKQKLHNASNEINFIRKKLFEIIKAFRTEFNEPDLRPYNIYELTDKNINDFDRMKRIMTNLNILLTSVFFIHDKIKRNKKFVAVFEESYKPKESKLHISKLLNKSRNDILQRISDDLQILRSYMRRYQFAKNITKFPISETSGNSPFSVYEIIFWNEASKNVNKEMDVFQLLQYFDKIRNDIRIAF